MFIKTFHFPSENAGGLFPSAPLKLGRPTVLSPGHQNVGGKDVQHFWVWTLKDLCNCPSSTGWKKLGSLHPLGTTWRSIS